MGVSVVRRSAALTGRDEELHIVASHVAPDAGGRPASTRLLTIEGPIGVGKSRLVDETRRVTDPDGRWLRIECLQDREERCRPVAVGLERLSGRPVSPPEAPGAPEQHFVEQVSRQVENGVTVLAIDDLQWADLGTLEIVRRLLDQADVAPMSMLATLRTGDGAADPGLGAILRHPHTSRLTLAGLEPRAGTELLVSLGVPITFDETLEALSGTRSRARQVGRRVVRSSSNLRAATSRQP